MPSKRVWHVCSNRWNSAITEYALSAAQALRLCGWESYFSALAAAPAARRAEQLWLEGPHFKNFALSSWLSFQRQARQIKPDIVLLYGGPETFLSRSLKQPKVRFRGQDRDISQTLPGWSTRLGLSSCAAIITPSSRVQARFQAILRRQHVASITLGLDTSRFRFIEPAFAQVSRPTLRLLGRLDPIKGHAFMFKIFSQLLAQWPASAPSPFLEIVGEAANLSELEIKGFAQQFGLREGQDWQLRAERVSELAPLLSATHVGLIPSLGSEVICRVAEEFLLCGCPIWVSGVGSLEDCLFAETAGFSFRGLSEVLAVEQLRQLLLSSWQENSLQRQERAAAAARHFSFERMGSELEALLIPLIEGR